LSISINNAITVTIPNKQLIFDEPYIASNGLIKRNPDWKDIPVVRYTDLSQNMPRLGGMFFSAAYLMVNHDRNEFSIAAAKETPDVQHLMGIDSANSCVAAVGGGATTTSDAPKTSPDTPASSDGISGRAIAGIVVGVVAGIAIIASIAFLIWRHRRPVSRTAELEATHGGLLVAEKHGYSTSEMYAGQDIAEFGGHAREYAVELDGSSRPAEVPASRSNT
jgi:hypothetical protein